MGGTRVWRRAWQALVTGLAVAGSAGRGCDQDTAQLLAGDDMGRRPSRIV